jgi:predicted RNA-binding protein (virulence factor B family)
VNIIFSLYSKVLSLTDTILAKLKANEGELKLSDKSQPEAIYAAFGVSKKVFKQTLGRCTNNN